MLVSELSACDADRMPSRSIVPDVTADGPGEASAGWSGAGPGRRIGSGPQGRVRPVELVDLRRRPPRQVLPARLREQLKPGLVDALCQIEPGRAFGDQRPMPRPLAAGHLAPRAVERKDGGAEVAYHPGPFGVEQPDQVPEVARRVRRARGQPPGHLVELRQQAATLVTLRGAGLLGERQPAQQTSRRVRVEAYLGGQQRHHRRAVPRQAIGITEDNGDGCPGQVRQENVRNRRWIAGVPLGRDRVIGGDRALAAQHIGQPPTRAEQLGGLLDPGTAREGQPSLHLGENAVQGCCVVQQVVDGRVVAVPGVDQVAVREHPFPGLLRRCETVLDRFEPAAGEREHQPRLRGAGLIAPGHTHRQNPSHQPVRGGVVAALHGGQGRHARRPDQRPPRAVLEPDA